MSEPRPVREWRRTAEERGPDLRLFRVRYDHLENPRTGEALRATVLETPHWANVVAITPEARFVVVRQFRFGVRRITVEIPGGVVERGEDPAVAAARELLEETGYQAGSLLELGQSQPNPAFHDNLCHHFLARDVVRVGDPALDPGEDLEVTTLSEAEIVGGVRDGTIQNALVLTALARVVDLRGAHALRP